MYERCNNMSTAAVAVGEESTTQHYVNITYSPQK